MIETEVLRGASWNNDPQNAHVDNCNANNPNNYNDNNGVRFVAVASTPYFSQNFGLGKSKANPILCVGRALWSPDQSPWSTVKTVSPKKRPKGQSHFPPS